MLTEVTETDANSTVVLTEVDSYTNNSQSLIPYSSTSDSFCTSNPEISVGCIVSNSIEESEELCRAQREVKRRDDVIEKLESKMVKIMESNLVLTDDREFLRGENVKLKNEAKQFKKQMEREIAELKSKNNKKAVKANNSHSILQTSNRFLPLRFESNEQQTNEASPDETGRMTPFNQEGSQINHKALLVTTSMARDIDVEEFNRGYEGGTAKFRRYHGGKVKNMKEFLPSKLEEEHSDIVVFQGGGNDLASTIKKEKPTPVRTIANDIIQSGRIIAATGSKVVISSVLPRSNFHLQLKRKELNDMLRGLCAANNFIYIDNSNIILSKHILPDGVHLNKEGTDLFSSNLLKCLNDSSC